MIDILILLGLLGAGVFFAKKYLSPAFFRGVTIAAVVIFIVAVMAKIGIL